MSRVLHCYGTEAEATAEFEKFLDLPGVAESRLSRLTALKGDDAHYFRKVTNLEDLKTLRGMTFHGVTVHSNITATAHAQLSEMMRVEGPDDSLQSY